ncbi:VanW family protein [Oscillibacter sp.]|uniref:VanW family protein n=1 Tax=Oscillibacter sp. TaxID=1945593 RepID=UPI0028A6FD7F|nr:VanW family protein [Oscillibacter sp.]
MDTVMVQEAQKKQLKLPFAIAFVLSVLAAGYVGLCAYAANNGLLWKNTQVLGQNLGGLTVTQAAQKLERTFPTMKIGLYLYDDATAQVPERAPVPDVYVALADLGAEISASAVARSAHQGNLQGNFFTLGWRYLTNPGTFSDTADLISLDAEKTQAAAEAAAQLLSFPSQDTTYKLGDDSILVHMAEDGRTVVPQTLAQSIESGAWDLNLALDVPYLAEHARTVSAQEIYDQTSGDVKNAGYDAATGTITPERVGADFDVALAQSAMDAAKPGSTVEIPAEIKLPAVTAEKLAPVLFRDLLGSYTTHVGGSAARIGNVKLSSSAVNGTVLNSGDIFDYNEVVGQRTAARGYLPAPAYVQGETVDEIGGGVCQPSSTLYLATLKSNLEIVERYAHRYVPAYIPKGMDATVSWGGPNYRFRNNTNYPIKVESVYSKGYLTMSLYGTKVDDTTVKITNKTLSTTPFSVVYEDDAALAAGKEAVKVTPYTGYKVETYRNLYDGEGNLISSTFEATSNYKVRNKVVLKGPALVVSPLPGELPEQPIPPETPGTLPEEEPGETTTPSDGTSGTVTPPVDETPVSGETGTGNGAEPGLDAIISPFPLL